MSATHKPRRLAAGLGLISGAIVVALAILAALPAEASHPNNYSYGNRAVGVNWYYNCTCWDNDVLDWLGGWATPGLPSQVKNSSYYPSTTSAWNDGTFPKLWVTKDAPGNGGEVFTVITPRPSGSCSNPDEPCQTHVHEWYEDDFGEWHELRKIGYQGWVDHVDLHYYAPSTENRCHNEWPGTPAPQGYYDCVATTVSHEVGHSLFLTDHSQDYDEDVTDTLMETPPDPRKFPIYRDREVAGKCIYTDDC